MNLIKRTANFFKFGGKFVTDSFHKEAHEKYLLEQKKAPHRAEVINFLLSRFSRDTHYLEIGVRYPTDNFNLIKANTKFSVDPGLENKANPVDFKMTSDQFFESLKSGEILSPEIKFDVIFIDGLHLAAQVDKDIQNAFEFLKEDGFIVLHDCNPPTEWHAREEYHYSLTPALKYWNGTTWKAFMKWRFNSNVYSCCIDTDWGVGILSKTHPIGKSIAPENEFFEYKSFAENRARHLNLINFNQLTQILQTLQMA